MISKKMQAKVDFARFCMNHNFNPLEVAELVSLVLRRVRTGTKECNFPGVNPDIDDKAMKAVEEKAASMGLRVDSWPGLYPVINDKDGKEVRLPF